MGLIAALARSHMNGSIPLLGTIAQPTETMPLNPKQSNEAMTEITYSTSPQG